MLLTQCATQHGHRQEGKARAPKEGPPRRHRPPVQALEAHRRCLPVLRGQCWCRKYTPTISPTQEAGQDSFVGTMEGLLTMALADRQPQG